MLAHRGLGRSVGLALSAFGEARSMSAFVGKCRAQTGWSGASAARHQDGRVLEVSLRFSPLQGQARARRWLASVVDISMPSGTR